MALKHPSGTVCRIIEKPYADWIMAAQVFTPLEICQRTCVGGEIDVAWSHPFHGKVIQRQKVNISF
jgi:hypothetical protein